MLVALRFSSTGFPSKAVQDVEFKERTARKSQTGIAVGLTASSFAAGLVPLAQDDLESVAVVPCATEDGLMVFFD